jgi:glucose-6-phosphate isomerase
MAISFDYSSASSFFKQSEVDYLSEFIKVAHNSLHERKSPGSDFLGWLVGPPD